MRNEFVPYDIALAMKELGFDEKCIAMFSEGKYIQIGSYFNNSQMDKSGYCATPLYQQAFRWLLEEVVNKEDYMITRNGGNADFWDGQVYGKSSRTGRAGWQYESQGVSYREAQEACLRKLIEIVKEK